MSHDMERREFLKTAAVAAVALAPGITLIAPREAAAAAGTKRWGMLIDAGKCTSDCTACVSACRTENGWTGLDRPATDPQWIRKVDLKDKATGATSSLPVMCVHCADAPCVDVCPTGASFQRPDGIVLVDRHVCIGCRYCMMACPIKARSFVHEHLQGQRTDAPRGIGTVEACTMCVVRVDAGLDPACADACQSNGKGAILFGDLGDPNSAIAKRVREVSSVALRPDLKLNPAVRYQGL